MKECKIENCLSLQRARAGLGTCLCCCPHTRKYSKQEFSPTHSKLTQLLFCIKGAGGKEEEKEEDEEGRRRKHRVLYDYRFVKTPLFFPTHTQSFCRLVRRQSLPLSLSLACLFSCPMQCQGKVLSPVPSTLHSLSTLSLLLCFSQLFTIIQYK